jgi:large subunit ribosomal protein L25
VVQENALQAELRDARGKGAGRKLRAKGRIPAVLYGLDKPNTSISVNAHELERLMATAGSHAMISLRVGDADEHVMLRESQRDPVKSTLVHADFFRIDPNKPIDIEVPVMATGLAAGVREGGLLEQLIRRIEIRCLPANMPSFLEIDVSNIAINHSLHVGEITAPGGVTFLTPAETAIFTVLPPKLVEEVVEPAAAAEVAEPEVIGKKKAEEGEAE